MDTSTIVALITAAISSSGITSIILYLLQRHDKKKDAKNEKYSAQNQMMIAIGHDRIVTLSDKYIKRGAITMKEKSNLQYFWLPYSAMGGNGDGKIGYEACMELSIVPDDVAEEMDRENYRKWVGICVNRETT